MSGLTIDNGCSGGGVVNVNLGNAIPPMIYISNGNTINTFYALSAANIYTNNLFATNIYGNGSGISGIVGSNIIGNVALANLALSVSLSAQPNITSLGTLTGLNVQGLLIASNGSGISNINASNIVGAVPIAGSVTNPSQTNITSVGTLTGLNVQGLLIASNGSAISNLNSGNVVGTVGTAYSVVNPAQPNITSVGQLTSLSVGGTLSANSHTGNGYGLSNLNASNVIGTVGTALSVVTPAQPNITSVGTLTGLSVQGLAVISNGSAISNLNSGNVVGTVGTAYSVVTPAQPNITSTGTLTGLNVQGLLIASNGSAISNLNSGNVVGTVGTALSVVTPAQPNITSVGTLTGLSVQGLAVISNGSAISNLNSGNVVGTVGTAYSVVNPAQPNITSVGQLTSLSVGGILSANLHTGNGYGLSNLNASNVTGTVGTAYTVVTPAQPNITSVGTLSNLNVNSNLVAGAYFGNGFGISNVNSSNLAGTLPLGLFPLTSATAGPYGSYSNVPYINIDQYGRVTSAMNVAITTSQWTSNGSAIVTSNVVSIGTLVQPPANANLYVVGNAVITNVTTNGSSISSLNSSNLFNTIPTSVLPVTGVTAGRYGSNVAGNYQANVAQLTVDTYGRITNASNALINLSQWVTVGPNIAYQNTVSIGTLASPGSDNSVLYVAGQAYMANAVISNGFQISQINPDKINGVIPDVSMRVLPGITSGTYGSNILVPQVFIDPYGRVSNIVNIPISTFYPTLNITTINVGTEFTSTAYISNLISNSVNTYTLNVISNLQTANLITLNSMTQNSQINVVTSNAIQTLQLTSSNIYGTNIYANYVMVSSVSNSINVISFSNLGGGSNTFVMSNTANIGIGVPVPLFKLDVEGDVNLGSGYIDNRALNFNQGEHYVQKTNQLITVGTSNTIGSVLLETVKGKVSLDPNGILTVNSSNIYLNGPGSNIWAANSVTGTNGFFTNLITNLANVATLNVGVLENVTNINVIASNTLTSNIQTANVQLANIVSLNVSGGANISYLNVFQQGNYYSSNLVTANIQTANTQLANTVCLNVSGGANISYLNVFQQGNYYSSNLVTANIQTANTQLANTVSLNVSGGANISYLNVFQQGNYYSSNLITANIQTTNVVTENAQFMNVSSNLISIGTSIISGTYKQSFNFTVAAGTGSYTNVFSIIDGPFSSGNYVLNIEMATRGTVSGTSGAKTYIITCLYNLGGGTWLRLLPIADPGGAGQISLDALCSGGTTYIRATTSYTTTEIISVGISLSTSTSSLASPSVTVLHNLANQTGTGATNSGFWPTTVLTERAGFVGVYTQSPTANLQVTGNIYASNALTTTNVITTSANISYGTISTLANIQTANIVTSNIQTANTVTSNILNLNVSTGSNTTYLTVSTLANVASANLVTANLNFSNTVTANILNLNVSTGSNTTYLTVSTLANVQTSNTIVSNVQNLNVYTGANTTYLTVSTLANAVSANIVTGNLNSSNTVTANILNLNVSTGSNTTYLTVSTLANVSSANLVTANLNSSNTVTANILNLNVSTGSNTTYLTVSTLANVSSANLVTANIQTANTQLANTVNLNVSGGANISYLNVFQQGNYYSSNLVTANVQTANTQLANTVSLNVSGGANISYLNVFQQGNYYSSNLVTANIQTANTQLANTVSLNVSGGANISYLNVFQQGNYYSSNLVTANIQTANVQLANIVSLNVSGGANVSYLNVFQQGNYYSSNLVTANIQTANTQLANTVSLNVSGGANISYLNVFQQGNYYSSNLITANIRTENTVTANILNLNVSTGANITYLTVSQLANIATGNLNSSNTVTANILNLNVSTGSNTTYLTVSTLANVSSANLVTANIQTANTQLANTVNLNVSGGANISYLNVFQQGNYYSSNLVTANIQTANTQLANTVSLNVSGGANISYLNVFQQGNYYSSNLVTANIQTANTQLANTVSLNVSGGANISYLNVFQQGNYYSSNLVTANIQSANIQTENVVFLNVTTTANVTNLTVRSNIVPLSTTGNTYITGNVIVSGNVYTQIGSPLGAGGGYYLSLPSLIVTQSPYTGSVGTAYPLSVGLSNGFTISGTSTFISVTPNGNFSFNTAGAYKITAVFYGSDNITGIAVGSNVADIHGQDQNYLYRYTTQITQNPTELIEIPLNITDTSKYYYLDIFMINSGKLYETANTTGGGTYLTITPLQGGGLATGGPGGTPGTQWISSATNIYFPNSVGVGTSPAPGYNLDVSTGTTATQRLVTSNISSLGLYGPVLNVNSNVIITANLAIAGLTGATPPYALTVYGQGYFSNHVSYENFAGFRNRIVNGTFRVAYRANSITVSNTSVYTSNGWICDRWRADVGNLSTSNVSVTVKQDVPVGQTNGFTQCANVFVSRAWGSTLDNTWICPLTHTIEASFVFDLKFGTSAAKPTAFSFSANTNVTGDYSIVFRSRNDNTYYANLVHMVAGTNWNRYTIYLPPCTIGTWSSGTAGYIDICLFGVSYGTGRANVATTTNWTAGPGYAPMACTGATNWAQTLGAYIQVTGPQWEVGTIATTFEVRPLSDTIRYCQRFYEMNSDIQYAAALGSGRVNSIPFVVTKRNHANVTVYRDLSNLTANTNASQFTAYYGNGTLSGTQAITSYINSDYGFSFNFTNTGSKFMDGSIMEAQFVWQADAEIY